MEIRDSDKNEKDFTSEISKNMQKDKADDYAKDFIAACKEGYMKDARAKEIIKAATSPDWKRHKECI